MDRVQRSDSLEKTLMLRKIEGGRRRRKQSQRNEERNVGAKVGRQKSSIKKSGENQLPPAPDTLSAPGNLKQLSGPQLPPPGEHDHNHALTAVKGLLRHDLVYLPQVALRRLPGMRWTDTDTGCPPNTGTHLNLQLPGGRHRAGGKGQEGCRRAPHQATFPERRGGWKSCFHVSRT